MYGHARPHCSALIERTLTRICVAWKGVSARKSKVDPKPSHNSNFITISYCQGRGSVAHMSIAQGPGDHNAWPSNVSSHLSLMTFWEAGETKILTEHGVKLLRVQIPLSPGGLVAFGLGIISMVKFWLRAKRVQDSEHAPEKEKCYG